MRCDICSVLEQFDLLPVKCKISFVCVVVIKMQEPEPRNDVQQVTSHRFDPASDKQRANRAGSDILPPRWSECGGLVTRTGRTSFRGRHRTADGYVSYNSRSADTTERMTDRLNLPMSMSNGLPPYFSECLLFRDACLLVGLFMLVCISLFVLSSPPVLIFNDC